MIQELREYSQSLIFKLLLGFICVTFAISFGVGSFFGDQKEVLAIVNSEEVLMREYNELYTQQVENFRRNFGENADQFIQQFNLRQQVLEQLINRTLVLQEAENLKMLISDKELAEYIQSQSFFQHRGRFDYQVYQDFLRQNRMSIPEYESVIRQDLLYQKYQNMMTLGLSVSEEQIEQYIAREINTIEVNYIYFDPIAFQSQVNYTTEELQEDFQKNISQYQHPRKFKIQYFTLSLEDLKNVDQIRERAVQRYYEKNIDAYTLSPEVKARHVLVRLSPEATEVEKLEKQQKIQEALSKLKEGVAFEQVVQDYSEEEGTKADGGDLGWFKQGEMVAAFENVAFEMSAGEISDVVTSPFGLHIIQVDEKKEESIQSLEEVQASIIALLSEQRAEKKLALEYDRLQEQMEQTNNLLQVASTFGKEVQSTDWFDVSSTLSKLGAMSELAGELVLAQKNEYGKWKRNPVLGHVFYQITEIEEPTPFSFEEAKEEVIAKITKRKATELANETATQLQASLSEISSLEEISLEYSLSIEETSFTPATQFLPKLSNDAEFKKVALSLSEKKRFGVSQNKEKSYLLAYVSSVESDDPPPKRTEIAGQIQTKLEQFAFGQEMQRLRNQSTIEIMNPLFQLNYDGRL